MARSAGRQGGQGILELNKMHARISISGNATRQKTRFDPHGMV